MFRIIDDNTFKNFKELSNILQNYYLKLFKHD